MQPFMGQSRLRKQKALHWDRSCSPPGVWMQISASKGHPVYTPQGSSFRILSLCLVLNSPRISIPNSGFSLLSSNWWEVSHSHCFHGNLLQEMLPEARICCSGTSCSSEKGCFWGWDPRAEGSCLWMLSVSRPGNSWVSSLVSWCYKDVKSVWPVSMTCYVEGLCVLVLVLQHWLQLLWPELWMFMRWICSLLRMKSCRVWHKGRY